MKWWRAELGQAINPSSAETGGPSVSPPSASIHLPMEWGGEKRASASRPTPFPLSVAGRAAYQIRARFSGAMYCA